jgi:anti-anti-sigma factor
MMLAAFSKFSVVRGMFSDRIPPYTHPAEHSAGETQKKPLVISTPHLSLAQHTGPQHPRAAGTWVLMLTLKANVEPEVFPQIQTQLIEEWKPQSGARCVIDLQHVEYLGSILLGLLINVRTHVRSVGGTVMLVGLPTKLTHIVRTASLDRLFEIYSSRDEALRLV